jgi:hypothetical protein
VEFVDVGAEVNRVAVPVSDLPLPGHPGLSPAKDLSHLDYEELLKRCAHPVWKPDPRTSVFHGADAAFAPVSDFDHPGAQESPGDQ